jgi:hypothetical protein
MTSVPEQVIAGLIIGVIIYYAPLVKHYYDVWTHPDHEIDEQQDRNNLANAHHRIVWHL